jgi:hypothetical protein
MLWRPGCGFAENVLLLRQRWKVLLPGRGAGKRGEGHEMARCSDKEGKKATEEGGSAKPYEKHDQHDPTTPGN